MIPNEELIKAISNDMKNYLPENIEIAFHNEFSYNPNANVDITLKMLRGEMTIKKLTQPVQFFIDVDELYFEDVFESIKNYAVDRNSVTITHRFKDNSAYLTDNITMYYNTPQLLSNAIDKGIKKVATFTLEARYEITQINFVQLDDIEVNISFNEDSHELSNIINHTFNVARTHRTETKGKSVVPSNDIQSIQVVLGLDYIYDKTIDSTSDEGYIHRYLHKHSADKDLSFEVEYTMCKMQSKGNCKLLTYSEQVSYGNTLACHIDIVFETYSIEEV